MSPTEDPAEGPVAEPAPAQRDQGWATRIRRRRPLEQFTRVAPHLPIAALIIAYTIYYSRLSVEIHRGYGTQAYDMGIFDQGMWLLSRFKAPFVTVMGRNLFGDHASLILLLLVPLYWVYPHPAALLIVQSLVLALGAVPVYVLARHLLHNQVWATVLAAALLLHPALQWGNLEQFHPECFLVPLLGFALYAAIEWRPWLLMATVGLALLVKEDVALLIVPLGLWVTFRRDKGFGLALIGAAAVYSALVSELVIASLVGTPTLYAGRIPFGGAGGLVKTLVRQPGQVFDYLRSNRRPFYAWQMIFPGALAFLRAPGVAAIGLVALAANVISNFPYQQEITTHYSLPLVPIVCMGTVFAISALKSTRQRGAAVGAVAFCSLWACFLWGVLPAFSMHKFPHSKPSSPEVHNINTVRAALPSNAVVSAYSPYVAHIDHRARVYLWPTPFKAAYWGTWSQEGQRLSFSDQIGYLLLPSRFSSSSEQALFDQVSSDFRVVRQAGDVVLLQRFNRGVQKSK